MSFQFLSFMTLALSSGICYTMKEFFYPTGLSCISDNSSKALRREPSIGS
jgi:hypothetical protein